MNHGTTDWRADFRLHTMYLVRPLPPDGDGDAHWILQDTSFRKMISALESDFADLCAIGGDPLPGQEISAEAIVAKLGYLDFPEPKGFLANAKFTAAFVAACTREMHRIQSEIARIRHLARPRARH
jgi:hypothetical protein